MRLPPRLVLQPGLYRSASTWTSNVIAELLRLGGPALLVYGEHADAIAQEIGTTAQAVVKAHLPDRALLLLAHLANVPVVMTVRDPLDCVASLMEQFYYPFEQAAGLIIRSTETMLALLEVCRPLVLRFEVHPRDATTVERIAKHVEVAVSEAQTATIAEKLSANAVASFIDRLAATGYFGADPQVGQFHRETHWHPRHLGRGVAGRHALVLSVEQIAAIDEATQVFRLRFGYQRVGETDAVEHEVS